MFAVKEEQCTLTAAVSHMLTETDVEETDTNESSVDAISFLWHYFYMQPLVDAPKRFAEMSSGIALGSSLLMIFFLILHSSFWRLAILVFISS